MRNSRRQSRAWRPASLLALGAILSSACQDTVGVPPNGAPQAPAPSASGAQASSAVDALARAIALALRDGSLRQQLLEDLRDSPFPRHALHLPSYLRGRRGATLAAAASQASGVGVDQLLRAADVRGGLQLIMPRPMDRSEWRGTDDIVVKGTALTLQERGPGRAGEFGYTVRGDRVAFAPWSTPRFPFVVLRPVDLAFGLDPEGARSAAPRRSGNSVSTRKEELSALLVEEDPCEGRTNAKECPSDGTGDPNGVKTISGYSYATCTSVSASAVDLDRDGVVDNCEYEVALALSPFLATSAYDCDLGREPYWIVEKGPTTDPQSLKIFYALSYYFDCGYDGVGSHLGDSEFIWMDVRYNNENRWEVVRAFLSAHWHSEVDYSALYAARDLEYYGPWKGQAVIWVAEDKHANYRSKSVCDSGAGYLDNCDHNSLNHGVQVLPSANLGSNCFRLKDAVVSRTGFDPYWNQPLPGTERFWSQPDGLFRGWYDSPSTDAGKAYWWMTMWFHIGRGGCPT